MHEKNQELSYLFSQLALHLEMQGIPFKSRAFLKVTESLESLKEDIGKIYQEQGTKGLEYIPGVGKGIAGKIEEYLKTGEIKELKEYKKKMPVNIDELTLVEGIGLKMVKELWEHLGIKNLSDLKKAAQEGKIAKLPFFGIKKEQNIIEVISFLQKFKGRQLLSSMYPIAQRYEAELKELGQVEQVVTTGSLRRMKETIKDIDILITTKEPKKAMDFFVSMVAHEKVLRKEKTRISLLDKEGFHVGIRVVEREIFGAALWYFTGSKKHNVKIMALAKKKGFTLSEHGLYKGKTLIPCIEEKSVYEALGMQYIEPELREDQGEIEAALKGNLPNLISYGALKGDLQVQTNWTDGKHSIEEMAKEAKKQGLEYISITDHTRDLSVTKGLDEKKLLMQAKEIDRVQKKISGFKILKGAEVNIRKDGTLDIANEALGKLDVVGVSVHSHFKMLKKDMTKRIMYAMQNPHVDILFHPTGRVVKKRDAYQVDMDEIIAMAKKTRTILEINGSSRMDLNDSNIKKAVQAKVKLIINSDAHHKDHFQFLKYGIAQARRGWATKADVINTKGAKDFLASLKQA